MTKEQMLSPKEELKEFVWKLIDIQEKVEWIHGNVDDLKALRVILDIEILTYKTPEEIKANPYWNWLADHLPKN